MRNIPSQLQTFGSNFIKIRHKSKIALENWKEAQNNYTYKEIKKYEGNVGFRLPNHIIAVDCDKPELVNIAKESKLPIDTFTIRGRPNRQTLFFECKQLEDTKKHSFGEYGDIRNGSNFYVVIPDSIHPNTEKPYTVLKDKPIQKITKEQYLFFVNNAKKKFNKSISSYISTKPENITTPELSDERIQNIINSNPKLQEFLNGKYDKNRYLSRSEAEAGTVVLLIASGIRNYNQINKIMQQCKIGKWKSSHEAYRKLTYENALNFWNNNKELGAHLRLIHEKQEYYNLQTKIKLCENEEERKLLKTKQNTILRKLKSNLDYKLSAILLTRYNFAAELPHLDDSHLYIYDEKTGLYTPRGTALVQLEAEKIAGEFLTTNIIKETIARLKRNETVAKNQNILKKIVQNCQKKLENILTVGAK
ncbi:MAG: bifunctional DNA primase/polymerase [Candidatus Nanoarchaeia archaeon]